MISPEKRTPEFEARRIEGVRRALKGHPPTEAQRKARADGLRRAWAEGRVQRRKLTPEQKEAIGARTRGKKRSPEVVEKVKRANIGKKRTPEQNAAMRARVIAGHAEGRYKTPLAKQEARNRAISEARRGIPITKGPGKKGPGHFNAASGIVRAPNGLLHRVKNFTHFVRENPGLFTAEQLQVNKHGQVLAACGLRRLFHLCKGTPGSWHGWTVFSEVERLDNRGRDLLSRRPLEDYCHD